MDYTSRMTTLLGQMRRQRNGAVAASMRSYGAACGLNYGVSLSTVRQIARAEAADHDFACYLYRQDVRELRLAALHLADPVRFVSDEFAVWAAGIVNSEIAEEAAFALLSRARTLPELFRVWIAGSDSLLAYAALQAAARSQWSSAEWIDATLEALRRWAGTESTAAIAASASHPAHIVAQGAVAFLAAIAARNEANRQAVIRAIGSLGRLPAEEFVREELVWRLEA